MTALKHVIIAVSLVIWSGVGTARAQGFDMSKGASEIDISADDGLEWQSEANRVVAHGNAKAVRGDVTVTADTLTAYYRSANTPAPPTTPAKGKAAAPAPINAPASPAGGNQIYRVDAEGHVTITNPNDTAIGSHAIYDLDKSVLILHGSPAKLVTPTDTFSADDTLEYWDLEHKAVLRVNAMAMGKDKKIQADLLNAYFKDQKDTGVKAKNGSGNGNMQLSHADALGHVILTTPKDTAYGDKGDYNADTGIASLTGAVTLVRDKNVLHGGYAHVDLNSGLSTLYGNKLDDTGPKQRVQGTFVPAQKTPATPSVGGPP